MNSNNENITSSAALSLLKAACAHKKFVSFKDLPSGEYIVINFSTIDTNYGQRIRIDLQDDTYMYLPEIFVKKLKPEVIDVLNMSPKIMAYDGKDANNHNALILDFNEVNYFDNEFIGLLTPKIN